MYSEHLTSDICLMRSETVNFDTLYKFITVQTKQNGMELNFVSYRSTKNHYCNLPRALATGRQETFTPLTWRRETYSARKVSEIVNERPDVLLPKLLNYKKEQHNTIGNYM